MNNNLVRKAAIACGHDEPISIEPDGSIWLGIDPDRQYLTTAQQKTITNKAKEMAENAAAAAASGRAKLAALGLTDDEINALVGA